MKQMNKQKITSTAIPQPWRWSTRTLAGGIRAEKRFRFIGLSAIVCSLVFLALLFHEYPQQGIQCLSGRPIFCSIFIFRGNILDVDNLASADYNGLVKKSLRTMFPEVKSRPGKKKPLFPCQSRCCFSIAEDGARRYLDYRLDPFSVGSCR